MSNFNALHTALEASVNALLVSGCLQVDLVMSPNFSVDDTGQITGASYRVNCVKPARFADPTTTITFDHNGHNYIIKLEETQCASAIACLDGICSEPSEVVCKSETP